MGRQLRLELDRVLRATRSDFVISNANADAVAMLDGWPQWSGGVLALVGPAGAGKSHLAALWAERAGAAVWAGGPVGEIADRPVLVENADAIEAEALFHLINAAPASRGLLLTARALPQAWATPLPDLRSRLNALPVAMLAEPDDAVLAGVLARAFAERSITPPDDLIPYLIRRIERSAPQARVVVARLDEEASALHRPVTRALAREVLDDTGDLFD